MCTYPYRSDHKKLSFLNHIYFLETFHIFYLVWHVNYSCYFNEFVEHAAQNDLTYLSDSYLPMMFAGNLKENFKNSKTLTYANQGFANIHLLLINAKAYNIIIDAISSKNIIQYTIPFNSNGLPIHFANDNKMELIMNVLLDIYMLYYSNKFIPLLKSVRESTASPKIKGV